MPPLTPSQFTLPPSVATSIGSAAAIIGRTGLYIHALRRQQTRDELFHLLSVAFLTKIPLLVEVVIDRLSLIN